MRRWLVLVLVLASLVLSACARQTQPTPMAGVSESAVPTPTPSEGTAESLTPTVPLAKKVVVVASTSVFASMVEVVGGNLVEVHAVMPPGADPHTYQPTPRDVAKLADAQLVVYNGGDLDPWMERQLEAVGSKAKVVVLAEGLEPPAGVAVKEEHIKGTRKAEHDHQHAEGTPEAGHDHQHAKETPGATSSPEHEHDHEHGVNPHFWLDPDFAVIYIERIAAGLGEVDPAHAEFYQTNAARYIEEIRNFDVWAKEQIASIPPERRKLVTFHDAFPYFAAHYGLELVGVVVLSPGREPSPQEVAQLVARIRAEGVPAIFVEPQFNPKLAQTIAQEAGVRVLELYSDAAPAGMDYLGMMRQNVTNVVEGLRG